jgi:hypothetical protein
MCSHRLQLFALAFFLFSAFSALQAGPARADDVDLRLLVELAFQHSDPADDVTESKITIYRGGGLRYESRLLFFREESCAERDTFALGEGTPAEVRTLERVLTEARVGQLTGSCHLHPSAASFTFSQFRWQGPYGDRSSTFELAEGRPDVGPPVPTCTDRRAEARDAILRFARDVLARPETRLLQGTVCHPQRP